MGIVLLLPREWKITHGGMLLTMSPDGSAVEKGFSATGNSNALVVLDLARGPLPVVISELARRVPDPLTIVMAWFRPAGTPPTEADPTVDWAV